MAHRKFIQFLTARKFKYLKIWRLLISSGVKITQLALKVSFGCDGKILVFIEKSHKKVQL